MNTKHLPSSGLRSTSKLSIFILSLVLSGLLLTGQARAAERTITPSVGVKAEYNDNIDFSHGNERDDYVGTISPGLKLDYKTERTVLGAMARIDVVEYLDETDENTVNQTYGLNASHMLLEKLGIRANAGYIRDTTTDSYLEETGLITRKSTRHSYRAGAGLTYNLTEISDLGLDYAYSKSDYDAEDKVDSTKDTVSMAYRHFFRERRDIVTVTPFYSRYDSDTSTTDNYGLSVGLTHRLQETLVMDVALGIRYSDAEYHDLGTTDDNWDWTANIAATKSWETASATIGYGRDLYYSDQGEPINVDRFYARTNRNLTERFGVSLTGSLYFSKSDDEVGNEDTRYWEVTPSLYYNITRDHRLEVGYSYANDYDKTLTEDDEAERNRIWVLLTFNFPKTW